MTKPFSLEEVVARLRVHPAPRRAWCPGAQERPADLRRIELDENP